MVRFREEVAIAVILFASLPITNQLVGTVVVPSPPCGRVKPAPKVSVGSNNANVSKSFFI